MKCCQDHWDKLRRAVKDSGMDHLVAQSGEAAAESLVRQLKGNSDNRDFDPLMGANWAIMAAYTRDVGLAGMFSDVCPLCEVERSKAGLAENWINGAVEDQLSAARSIGLMPPVS